MDIGDQNVLMISGDHRGNSGQPFRQPYFQKLLVNVIQNIEMESRIVLTSDLKVDQALIIKEFAEVNGLDRQRMGKLIVAAKNFADNLLDKQLFSDQIIKVPISKIKQFVSPKSDSELSMVANYLRLRNIGYVL